MTNSRNKLPLIPVFRPGISFENSLSIVTQIAGLLTLLPTRIAQIINLT